MKLNKIIFFFAALMLIFSSCRKNTDETIWENENRIDLDGFILNEEGLPVTEASIIAGGLTTMTDENGYFEIYDALATGDFVYVKANKAGYFEGSRLLSVRATGKKHLRIKMIPEVFDYKFEIQDGGSIIMDDEVRIDFPNSSIADENGNLYTGEIRAAVHYIDPTTDNGRLEMPGNLIGTDANQETVSLSSYGMIAVELKGSNNEKLNIAAGMKATIAVKVPPSLQSSAPKTISLWHFNETSGLWIEDGLANLVGDEYVGEVSHFSFWNCDYPNALIYIKGRTVSQRIGRPVRIVIKADDGTQSGSYSDEDGYFEGYVPENLGLTLILYDACDNIIKSMGLGPFEGSNDLGDIDLGPTFDTNENTLTGVIRDCNGSPIEGASININGGSTGVFTDSNGRFEYVHKSCNSNSVEIKTFDFDNQIQGVIHVLPGIDHDVDITMCDDKLEAEEYIYMEMSNGETYLILNDVEEIVDDTLYGIRLEGPTSVFGHLKHNEETINLNTDLPVERFFLSTGLKQGPPSVQTLFLWFSTPIGAADNFIRYTSKAGEGSEYTEGIFKLENASKNEQTSGQLTLIEPEITITGRFKIKLQ